MINNNKITTSVSTQYINSFDSKYLLSKLFRQFLKHGGIFTKNKNIPISISDAFYYNMITNQYNIKNSFYHINTIDIGINQLYNYINQYTTQPTLTNQLVYYSQSTDTEYYISFETVMESISQVQKSNVNLLNVINSMNANKDIILDIMSSMYIYFNDDYLRHCMICDFINNNEIKNINNINMNTKNICISDMIVWLISSQTTISIIMLFSIFLFIIFILLSIH